MNYQLLYGEISQPTYANMTDAEIVAALNAQTTVRRRVPIADLQARAMESGVYIALRMAVISAQTPDDVRAVCQMVLDLANARFADVNLDSPASRQMFAALQEASIITAQQAAAIDALATVQQPSRAETLGLGVVDEDDLAAARAWQAAQEAERARLAAYQALRERLVGGQLAALAWLQSQQDGGQPAPGWDDVVARL